MPNLIQRTRKHSAGIALITALLIVALAATTAAAMVSDQLISFRRTSNTLDTQQAWLYALGIETWSLDILIKDQKETQSDSLDEPWATLLPPFDVDGGQINGYIEDAQGRFNLNNLIREDDKKSPKHVAAFQLLLDATGVTEDITPAIIDWLDSNIDLTFPGGAEDNEYLSAEFPYRAGNHLMSHASELRLVQGVTAEIYSKLEPYIIALPKEDGQPTLINANTAPAIVLQTLSDKLNPAMAEELIQSRNEEPWDEVSKFTDAMDALTGGESDSGSDTPSEDEPDTVGKIYGVESNYFVLHADARIGNSNTLLDSLIYRPTIKSGSGTASGDGSDATASTDADDEDDKIRVLVRGWGNQ